MEIRIGFLENNFYILFFVLSGKEQKSRKSSGKFVWQQSFSFYKFFLHKNRMNKFLHNLYFYFTVTITLSGSDAQSSFWDENYSQPYFDNTTKRDMTVTIGQTALLHCRVRNLGDRAVSYLLVILYNKCFIE